MPLVSILIPVKNAAPWLDKCLQSILQQSYTNWEVIAIDDHSTDKSFSILENWATKHKSIYCFKNHSEGIIPALVLAFKKAKGRYITRMDADDIMPSFKLEALLQTQLSFPNSVVTGKVKYFSDDYVSEGYIRYQNWLNERCVQEDHWNYVYRECVIASANWLTTRENIDAVGGFENLTYPEDYDLVLKWYFRKVVIKSVLEITHLWREHPKRTSRNSLHYQQKAFFKLKIHHFVKHSYSSKKNLILLGSGSKGKIVAALLNQLEVKFTWVDRISKHYSSFPNNPVYPLTEVESFSNVQLLISIYPADSDLKQLLKFLNQKDIEIGINGWLL